SKVVFRQICNCTGCQNALTRVWAKPSTASRTFNSSKPLHLYSKSPSDISSLRSNYPASLAARTRLLCNLIGATRQSPVGPDEMASVAAWISLEVILMLGFGLPELACRTDFGHNLLVPQSCSI